MKVYIDFGIVYFIFLTLKLNLFIFGIFYLSGNIKAYELSTTKIIIIIFRVKINFNLSQKLRSTH
jgi:hypothetical protein